VGTHRWVTSIAAKNVHCVVEIYIYNFAGNSWSTQSTSSPPPDFGNSRSATILDHDTNVFFTLTSGSGLYQLDLSSVQATAASDSLAWEAVTAPSFSTNGYTPVAAQASNHINYFGVPNTSAGSADIFIVGRAGCRLR
jgi:outer membrane protease